MNKQQALMLAEQVGLTDKDLGQGMTDYGDASEAIFALVKAVSTDCAKRCEAFLPAYNNTYGHDGGPDECAKAINDAYKGLDAPV